VAPWSGVQLPATPFSKFPTRSRGLKLFAFYNGNQATPDRMHPIRWRAVPHNNNWPAERGPCSLTLPVSNPVILQSALDNIIDTFRSNTQSNYNSCRFAWRALLSRTAV